MSKATFVALAGALALAVVTPGLMAPEAMARSAEMQDQGEQGQGVHR